MSCDLNGLESRSSAYTAYTDCTDCPVYRAPLCFRELLSNSFKSPSSRWRRFATYFNIHEPVGPEGLVELWVEKQQKRDANSIKSLLEFATNSNCVEDTEFRVQLEKLIAEHQSPGHFCNVYDPAACFQRCSKCLHIPPPPPIATTESLQPPPPPFDKTTISDHDRSFTTIFVSKDPKPVMSTSSGSHQPSDKDDGKGPRIRNNIRSLNGLKSDTAKLSHDPKGDVLQSYTPTIDCDNILHYTESSTSLFKTMFPYNEFDHRHKWLEFVIVFFLVYQMIASTFITICEDEGPYRVFSSGGRLDLMEFVRRICLYVLRIIVRVAMPFIFYRQICRMAEGERRYLSIKDRDGPENFTTLDKSSKQQKPSHHLVQEVTLWSSIVPHAVMFSLILLSLGVFLTAEDKLIGDTICIRELFQIQVPFIGMQIFQLADCLAVFFMMMVIGILKDCYCLENHLAVRNYEIMRQRWILIDTFCYVTAFILFAFTVLMFIFGNPLTPPPSSDVDVGGLQLWSFWIIALTFLQFCGSAANSILKKCCIVGHLLCFLFILLLTFVLKVKKISVPPGSTVLLLYTTLAVTLFNLLLCLTLSHYRNKGCKSKRFHFSVACLVILSVSVLATAVREITHFAFFVLQD